MLGSAKQDRAKEIAAAALNLLKLEPAVKEILSTHVSGKDLQLFERLIANVDEEPLFFKINDPLPTGRFGL